MRLSARKAILALALAGVAGLVILVVVAMVGPLELLILAATMYLAGTVAGVGLLLFREVRGHGPSRRQRAEFRELHGDVATLRDNLATLGDVIDRSTAASTTRLLQALDVQITRLELAARLSDEDPEETGTPATR